MDEKSISSDKTVGLVLNVHRDPGIGMLESSYGQVFAGELTKDKLAFQKAAPMPAGPNVPEIKRNYRVDLLINGKMIVELKGSDPLSE